MELELRGRGVGTLLSLRTHAERRLSFAFGKLSGHAARALVRVEDINGPRGGADKRCRIQVELIPSGTVIAEATGEELYSVVDLATKRAARAVRRRLGRHSESRRRPHHRSLRRDADPELPRPAPAGV